MAKKPTTEETLREFAKKRVIWKKNPAMFFKEVLGITMPLHQRKMLDTICKNNRISIKSSNSIGKCPCSKGFSLLGDGTIVKNYDLIDKEFNILSYNPDTNTQYSETARAIDNGEKECYEIKLQSGKVITRTHNHPLYKAHIHKTNRYLPDGRRLTIEPVADGWVTCEDLEVGDYILVPKIHRVEPTKFDFTDDEAKLLGYILGDGGVTTSVIFTQEDNKQLKEFIQICENLGSEVNKTREYTYSVRGDGTKGGNPVLQLVREWGLAGHKSIEKLMPEFVGRLPLHQIALILNRFFACDGYAITRKTKRVHNEHNNWKSEFLTPNIGITLANYDLIQQIRLLLMRFGIEAWTRHKPSKYDGKVFDAWELSIGKRESLIAFCEQIGIYGKEEAVNKCLESARLKSTRRTNKYQYLNCPPDFMWERIQSIKNVGLQPTVCIEVDNTHTYLTEVYDHNSFIVGATAFWYFFTNVSKLPDNDTIIIITAPVFSQIRRSIFANIKDFADRADNYIKTQFGENASFLSKNFSESANVAEYWFNKKSYIMGIATDNCNAISGIHAKNLMVIFDEAQGIPESTYSGFEGVFQGGKCKFILLGNTTLPDGPSGNFYNSFSPDSPFTKISVSAFETPNFVETGITLKDMLAPEADYNHWIKKLDRYCGTDYYGSKARGETGLWEDAVLDKLPYTMINPISAYQTLVKCGMNPESYEFKTRILAEFPTADSANVISSKDLEISMNNYNNPNFHVSGIRSMGLDISGGTGRDFYSICIRDGNKVIYLERVNNVTAPEFEELVIKLYREYHCDYCNIERDGVGKPVYDHLNMVYDMVVNPIQSGGGAGLPKEELLSYEDEENDKVLKQTYNRKRDELWFNMRNLLNKYTTKYPVLLPNNDKLKKHLLCATWKKNNTGKIQVLDKDSMRLKIKESPDLADAVLMAFAPVGEIGYTTSPDVPIITISNGQWS